MYKKIVILIFTASILLLYFLPSIHGRGQINLYVRLLLYVLTLLGLYMSMLIGHIKMRMLYTGLFVLLTAIILLMHTFNIWI
ncbi:hypothetical protein QNJ24_01960 [Macrococcus caseolyticus]|uniref:hypothetical protein n=1 Tax=Macrococcoides caseolyticum TaxID=69966 RepID=UPI000C3442B9|nr:hypothetical protein [Macrococcus caseolyticus]MDJ1154851.1 hypothetical protein [Macrococcus caseolyticus]PKE45393.1 hypothetical protein CW666_02275 [Macrococcus caseolyticus]